MEWTAASEDLVALWEDYQVVAFFPGQKIYRHYMKLGLEGSEPIDSVPFDMFSRFPQLLKVLQAWQMCRTPWYRYGSPSLFSIRFLLDLSWNEMRRAFIRPLKENHAPLQKFFAAAYAAEPCPTLRTDLGQGCLRLLKEINNGNLPPEMSVKAHYSLSAQDLIPL
jgi:hypothetical protein